jgi:hypothetical protein
MADKSYSTSGLGHSAAKPAKSKKTKKHNVKHTHIEHHDDGSHTIRHTHEVGPDTTGTAPDLDALHDHLEAAMGTPNQGEAEAEAPQPGQAPQLQAAPQAA